MLGNSPADSYEDLFREGVCRGIGSRGNFQQVLDASWSPPGSALNCFVLSSTLIGLIAAFLGFLVLLCALLGPALALLGLSWVVLGLFWALFKLPWTPTGHFENLLRD